ncbi:MAG: type II toxin-antitoxin system HicB family antitoxin [Chloroflexi bacterium]|nr:type II toxin-antitoxin system HicB family antitoxin [Chloroflexota bacterium]
MLTAYIRAAMQKAQYKILDDSMYFGEIPGFQGVWASKANLEECRRDLQEVLEEWLLLKLRDDEEVPELEGITLSPKAIKA